MELNSGMVVALISLSMGVLINLMLTAFYGGKLSQKVDTHDSMFAGTERRLNDLDRRMRYMEVGVAKMDTTE